MDSARDSRVDESLKALVGKTLADRYRVEELLGAGGMGAVFRAHHTGLKRDVALKVLHPDIGARSDGARRFEREAQSASRLDHPGCVRVMDFGSTEDDMRYLVMEFLQGTDLSTMLGYAWEPQRAVDVMMQIMDALGHAHENGVVHRDLKPENIFLTFDAKGEQQVKLVDFGIAKLTDPGSANERLTRTGVVFGSPRYMSPEQAAGGTVDERTDIYAAGLIFYEMLQGRPPFESKDAGEMIRMQIMTPAPPLPDTVPSELAKVVLRMLSKAQDERPSKCAEVMASLDRIRDSIPVVGAAAPPEMVATPTAPISVTAGTMPPVAGEAPTLQGVQADRVLAEAAKASQRTMPDGSGNVTDPGGSPTVMDGPSVPPSPPSSGDSAAEAKDPSSKATLLDGPSPPPRGDAPTMMDATGGMAAVKATAVAAAEAPTVAGSSGVGVPTLLDGPTATPSSGALVRSDVATVAPGPHRSDSGRHDKAGKDEERDRPAVWPWIAAALVLLVVGGTAVRLTGGMSPAEVAEAKAELDRPNGRDIEGVQGDDVEVPPTAPVPTANEVIVPLDDTKPGPAGGVGALDDGPRTGKVPAPGQDSRAQGTADKPASDSGSKRSGTKTQPPSSRSDPAKQPAEPAGAPPESPKTDPAPPPAADDGKSDGPEEAVGESEAQGAESGSEPTEPPAEAEAKKGNKKKGRNKKKGGKKKGKKKGGKKKKDEAEADEDPDR